MQEYNHDDLLSIFQQLMGNNFYKMTFQYEPKKANEGVALNFHLTRQEKLDVANALNLPVNVRTFRKVDSLLNP